VVWNQPGSFGGDTAQPHGAEGRPGGRHLHRRRRVRHEPDGAVAPGAGYRPGDPARILPAARERRPLYLAVQSQGPPVGVVLPVRPAGAGAGRLPGREPLCLDLADLAFRHLADRRARNRRMGVTACATTSSRSIATTARASSAR
jgi:hypothetical protein